MGNVGNYKGVVWEILVSARKDGILKIEINMSSAFTTKACVYLPGMKSWSDSISLMNEQREREREKKKRQF